MANADDVEREELAQFLRRHKVFLRRARDTSHQSLFFVGLLADAKTRKAKAAVEEYRGFALEQIRSLVRAVHLPDSRAYEAAGEWLAAEEGRAPGTDPERRARVRRALQTYRLWRAIFDLLDSHDPMSAQPRGLGPGGEQRDDASPAGEPSGDADPPRAPAPPPTAAPPTARQLRTAFETFLAESRPGGRIEGLWQIGLADLLHFLHKNLALLWGALLVAWVAFAVPAVSSLLWNEGWGVLFPLGVLLVPLVASRGWMLFRRLWTPGVVPFWDLSGPAFRSFRNQAREPGRLIERWKKGGHLRQELVAGHAIKIAAYVAWWWLGFVTILLLHRQGAMNLSASSRTVFLVLSFFYAILIFAHLVDFWEYLDPRPVRFLFLLAGIAAFVFLLLGAGRLFFVAAFLLASAVYAYAYSRDRRSPLRLVLAVVFLVLAAANVQGWVTHDRAVWTDRPEPRPTRVSALVPVAPAAAPWPRLTQWPWPAPDGSGSPVVVMAASGGGSRAAVYTAMVLRHLNQDLPEVAARLQAISSVSGGSLASAGYVARLLDQPDLAAEPPATRSRDLAVPLTELERAVGEDFLFPTLKGALLPRRTRGEAIEREWERGPVALGSHTLRHLAEKWRGGWGRSAYPPFPIPLFNSATLDGHDVVITPLDKRRYMTDRMYEEARDLKRNLYRIPENTWVYYRDAIYSLEDMLRHYDPRLSQAVRASANFPFGFPLVRIRTEEPLVFSPKHNKPGRKQVMLTDGGTLSNSGMWSLFNLLMPDEVARRRELKSRGVLLLVVEASKMPQYPKLEQSLNALWSTIGDQGPVGQRLHRLMFDALEREYGDRIAIVQLDIIPESRYNVLTSWALDRKSIGLLETSFESRWTTEVENLRAAYASLTGKDESPEVPQLPPARFLARSRPPLD